MDCFLSILISFFGHIHIAISVDELKMLWSNLVKFVQIALLELDIICSVSGGNYGVAHVGDSKLT